MSNQSNSAMATNNRAIFDPKNTIPHEKYISIYGTGDVVAPAQQRVLVHARFPLSVLRKYSTRAMHENLPRGHWQAGQTTGAHIDWDIEMPVLNNTIQIGGFQEIFKWILETQPAVGYPESFKGGAMRFPDARHTDFLARLLIFKAITQLGMRPEVGSRLRSAIRDHIETSDPLSDGDLDLSIRLLDGVDDRLVNIAISTHCGQFGQRSLRSAIMRPYNVVFEASNEDVQGRWTRAWNFAKHQAAEAARTVAAA